MPSFLDSCYTLGCLSSLVAPLTASRAPPVSSLRLRPSNPLPLSASPSLSLNWPLNIIIKPVNSDIFFNL